MITGGFPKIASYLLLTGIFLLILAGRCQLLAQSSYHFSAMASYELTQGYYPGYDFTAILNRRWGLRYTVIPNLSFEEGSRIINKGKSLISYQLQGDFKTPMIFRAIDYKSFQNRRSGPFDFLTAYLAAGYNKITVKLKQQQFLPVENVLRQRDFAEDINFPVYSLALGLYGGEKFVVIDSRVLYFRGILQPSSLFDQTTNIDHWLILFSLGFGF